MNRLKKLTIYLLTGIVFTWVTPIRTEASWRFSNNRWLYTEGNSYAIGWRYIGSEWYYFDSQGYMVFDTSIEGYYLNSDGKYRTSVTLDEAKKIFNKYIENDMYKQDKIYRGVVSKSNHEYWYGDNSNLSLDKFYSLIGYTEDLYYFGTKVMDNYYIGKETGRLYYFCPGNGLASLDIIENNTIIKSFYKNKVGDQSWS